VDRYNLRVISFFHNKIDVLPAAFIELLAGRGLP
jgi:hypothetical protein